MLNMLLMLGGIIEAFMVLVGESENFRFLVGWFTMLFMLATQEQNIIQIDSMFLNGGQQQSETNKWKIQML